MVTPLIPQAVFDQVYLIDRRGWLADRLDAAARGQLHAVTFWQGRTQVAGPFDCELTDRGYVPQGGETNGARSRQVALTIIGLDELDAVPVGATFTGGGLTGQIQDKRVLAPERAELDAVEVRGAA